MEMSPWTPSRPWAPVRPSRKPVITSSITSSAPCSSAQRLDPFEVSGRRRDQPGVAHHRLHHHARHVAHRQRPRHLIEVVPLAHEHVGGGRDRLAGGERHGPERLRRRRRVDEQRVEPTVVVTDEPHHSPGAGRGAGDPDREQIHLGAGQADPDALHPRQRADERFGELRLQTVLPGEELTRSTRPPAPRRRRPGGRGRGSSDPCQRRSRRTRCRRHPTAAHPRRGRR